MARGEIEIRAKTLTVLLLCAIIIIFASCKNRNLTDRNDKQNSPPVPSVQPPSSSGDGTGKSNNSPFRFVVMADSRGSDNGINFEIVTKTFESIKKLTPQPLFAIMPGDLVEGNKSYTELKAQLLNFKNTAARYYPVDFLYPGFGNHEAIAGTSGEQAFEEVFSQFKGAFLEGFHKTVYYFDKNDTRFYMLNTNHPGENHIVSDLQLNWIKENTDPAKKYNFFFFHEPAYPTGPHVGSSLDTNKLQRNKLWEVIDQSQNPMVFCGHEHFYTRRHINSSFNETIFSRDFVFNKLVYQLTVGTFGAPLYKEYKDMKNIDIAPVAEYHYAIVDVNSDNVKVTVFSLDGRIIDSFEQ